MESLAYLLQSINFAPLIDIPLASLILAGLIWNFHLWVGSRDIDTTVDISSRLAVARFRVIVLFACLLLLCWCLNLAFWSIVAMLLGVGVVCVVFSGGDAQSSLFGLLAIGYVIREWAFGFPQLVLHPQPQVSNVPAQSDVPHVLIGKTGITTSPLRPSGDADIDGVEQSVISFDGSFIDTGTKVVVRTCRNGTPCVSTVSARAITCESPSSPGA